MQGSLIKFLLQGLNNELNKTTFRDYCNLYITYCIFICKWIYEISSINIPGHLSFSYESKQPILFMVRKNPVALCRHSKMVKPAEETTRRKVTIFNYPHRIPYPNKAHATKIVMGWMIMVVLPIFITVVRVS